MTKDFKRYLVTSALPYANGPLHIGHIAGAYLPADIYARFKRLSGSNVLYICGSDEHGVAIPMRAKKEGVTPQQIIDKYHGIIKQSFEDFRRAIISLSSVQECYLVTGSFDFLVKARVKDMAAYRDLLEGEILSLPGVKESTSIAAMETVKETLAINI